MILVDAGPLLALFDPRDAAHLRVTPLFESLRRDRLVIPAPVIPELAYFLPQRVGVTAEVRLLHGIAGGEIPVIDPISADYSRAAWFVEKYANFPLGTVDALIAAMAERLGVTTLFTLDQRHFGAIQPAHCERFTLVP
ncbi:MAG: PIN domain-containing protein [Dehalococcoidia bacterium]|nr:PIN domain-containing protein [Dehalococcoidia bacterium]MCL4232855.1 PIN domain-containing protein [Dehalococcoidia bacterium]NUQ55558.1 PIN domain-containing protein [Dehalococcoidia bacterium]